MKITIFGSTGNLGQECLLQCLKLGYETTVLVRSPEKIPDRIRNQLNVLQGDALSISDVTTSLPEGTDAILFAIGMKKGISPDDLCTRATENIIRAMRQNDIPRLVWCGGGSNIQKEDVITWGSKFVRRYSNLFLRYKHIDKEHQIDLLEKNRDLSWIGIRPLQMKHGEKTGTYRLGYNAFSGLSKITFADCAHAMINMLADDTWVGKMPIIQY
jgi:putative NADH-flavin reductase